MNDKRIVFLVDVTDEEFNNILVWKKGSQYKIVSESKETNSYICETEIPSDDNKTKTKLYGIDSTIKNMYYIIN